jgi:hypothetical protein
MSKKNDKSLSQSTFNKTTEQKEVLGKFRPSVKRLKQITDASEKFLANASEEELSDITLFKE